MKDKEDNTNQPPWVESLLDWYNHNKRDLPWRRTKDPYKIWISEIMLQQTRVDTVVSYYLGFIDRFPDLPSLAGADLDEVFKLWEGLGYYSRAKNLHRASQQIMAQHGGVFPKQYDQILSLSGIGPYTAGAIVSIAFDQPYPALDGNAYRVFSRIFNLHDDISKGRTAKRFAKLIVDCMPPGQSGDYNQGIMELGALICVPREPRCHHCPIQDHCVAFQDDCQRELPVKTGKPKVKKEHRHVVVIQESGQFLLNKRKDDGLLGGLWEFPGVEAKSKQDITKKLQDSYGLQIGGLTPFTSYDYQFTHRHWQVQVYQGRLLTHNQREGVQLRWFTKDELQSITIPKAFANIVTIINQQ